MDAVRADVFFGLGESSPDAFKAWQDHALAFTRATSTSSWTVPAVGSVFSGLWQYGHGAGQLPSMKVENRVTELMPTQLPTALYEDVPLLVEAAVAKGFDTATISASPWTNGSNNQVGLIRGFQKTISLGEEGAGRGFAKMKEAFAEKPNDAPFFYYLHFMEAHEWHKEPEAELDARIARFSPEERALFLRVAPPHACEDERSLLCKRYLVYASAVSTLRNAIAKGLAEMKAGGLLDDTAVVVFSDHGERFGDHDNDERIAKANKASRSGFLGHGHSMYQELLHVPLIAWHPGYQGAVIDELVSLVDMAPTVARWLDIDFLPAKWPGQYLDVYLEPSKKALDRVVYASGIVRGEQQIAALQGMKKSIWYMVSDQYDYYELGKDPNELRSEPNDGLVLLFDGLFLDYVQSKRDLQLKPVSFTAKQLQRLQAIGYLEGAEAGDTDANTN
jgi:arylsulfatase A-like enzyme